MSSVLRYVDQLVKETSPADDVPRLEMQDGGRINFSKAGLVETKPFFNQMTGKNFSQKAINNIKKFGVEKYKKLTAGQRADVRRGSLGERFMTEEKKAERAKRLRPVFKGKGSKLGETPKVVDVSGPKELKKEYIDDFKKRLQYPKAGRAFKEAVEKGEALSNPQLAKKYGITLTEVERLNMFFTKQKNLKYKKGTPASGQELRRRRLSLTQPGSYIRGKGKIQFHHIMPIGGDVDLTSKDVAFINKYVNASLQKYNNPLNRIADGISDNLARYSESKDSAFLKRIDDLNTQAAQIVDKTKKELPKKLQGLIGFNKITPVLDENATLINTTVERIGIDEAKTPGGVKGPKVKLSEMRSGTYTPGKFAKEAARVSSGPTLGMNLGFLPALKTAGEVIGSPAAALAFATQTVRENLRKGESLPAAVADKFVGAELLAPGAISRFAPGVMKGILGLGKVARSFTPIGAGLTAAGVAKDVIRESRRRAALSDEERLEEDLKAQEEFDETMIGAAGGGLLKQAGDRSGKPPEAGPVSDGGGLPYIFNRVKNV
jgi:hypothetical protein